MAKSEKAPDVPDLEEVEVLTLTPAQLEPWPGLNPRTRFDADELHELEETIRQKGVLLPLVVRHPVPDGEASDGVVGWVVAGERRWRAASNVRPDTPVTCVGRDYSLQEALEIALIENLDRSDLSPVEEARGLARWLEEAGLSQRDAAEKIGRSQSWISNRLRLLELPDGLLELVLDEWIPASMARDLLLPFVRLEDRDTAEEIWELAESIFRQDQEDQEPPFSWGYVRDTMGAAARRFSRALGWAHGEPSPHYLFERKDGSTGHRAEGPCAGCTCGAIKYPFRQGTDRQRWRCFDEERWLELNRKAKAQEKEERKTAKAEREATQEEEDQARIQEALEELDPLSVAPRSAWQGPDALAIYRVREQIWPEQFAPRGQDPHTRVDYLVDELDETRLFAAEDEEGRRFIYYLGTRDETHAAREAFMDEVDELARERRKAQARADLEEAPKGSWRGSALEPLLQIGVELPGASSLYAMASLAIDLEWIDPEGELAQRLSKVDRFASAIDALPELLEALSADQVKDLAAVVAHRIDRGYHRQDGEIVWNPIPKAVRWELGYRERDRLQEIIPDEWGFDLRAPCPTRTDEEE